MVKQLFNSLIFQLNVFTCVEVLADLSRRKLLKFDVNLNVSKAANHDLALSFIANSHCPQFLPTLSLT